MIKTGAFTFKKFTGEKLDNIEEYVKEYCQTHSNIDILIGTDSQNRGPKTIFSTIIAMYDKGDGDGHGHGAHCVLDVGVPIVIVSIRVMKDSLKKWKKALLPQTVSRKQE